MFTENNSNIGLYYKAPNTGGNIKSPDPFTAGIFCNANKNSSNGDSMLKISQILVLIALCMSAFLSVIFWSIALFMKATNFFWKLLSITTALAAFLQVPGFLILNGKTCNQYDCHLSAGAFSLIGAIVCMSLVTVITQLCDAPTWIQLRDAWKVNQRRFDLNYTDTNSRGSDDDYYHILSTLKTRRKISINPISFFSSIFYSGPPRHVAMTDDSPDDDGSDDDDIRYPHKYPHINGLNQGDEFIQVQSYDTMMKMNARFYTALDNSRLLLHVTPNGRQLGDDDRRSEWSFANSLEEDIRFAEMEKGLVGSESDHQSDSIASDQSDQHSVSSRTSLNPKKFHPVTPLQFSPSAQQFSSRVTSFDSYPVVHGKIELDQLEEQSLLDSDILIKGASRQDILSPLHISSRVIGSIFTSSLQTASSLMKFNKCAIDDKGFSAATSSQQLSAPTIKTDGPDYDRCKIVDDDESPELPHLLKSIVRPREASPKWENFEDVNEFQKAVDAGENAANITNQTEEDITMSTCTPDNDSESSILDVDVQYNREETKKVVIAVQQLNRIHRQESKKKKRKKSKIRSSSSACSRHSLLDLTIDEETQDDLQLEDMSCDENKSSRSGVRYKSTNSLSSLDGYEQGYLSRNNSSPDDTLTAGLRLVASVLSKMKEVSQKETYETMKDTEKGVFDEKPMESRDTVKVSSASIIDWTKLPVRSIPHNYGSDEGSM